MFDGALMLPDLAGAIETARGAVSDDPQQPALRRLIAQIREQAAPAMRRIIALYVWITATCVCLPCGAAVMNALIGFSVSGRFWQPAAPAPERAGQALRAALIIAALPG
ncbi:MAG: hypothetical protein MZV49_10475 [Rhodopseudomonas palustris]|nr:hypothetical protein [Rhodopseudomonas palustris]